MKSCGVTIQMKATDQYFPVVLVYYAVQSASCTWYYFVALCFGLFLIFLNINFGHFPQGKEYSEGSIKLFL